VVVHVDWVVGEPREIAGGHDLGEETRLLRRKTAADGAVPGEVGIVDGDVQRAAERDGVRPPGRRGEHGGDFDTPALGEDAAR
jgi:hypothetical protein